jgi:hypothetical protein
VLRFKVLPFDVPLIGLLAVAGSHDPRARNPPSAPLLKRGDWGDLFAKMGKERSHRERGQGILTGKKWTRDARRVRREDLKKIAAGDQTRAVQHLPWIADAGPHDSTFGVVSGA